MPNHLRIAHLTPAFFSEDSYVGGGERYVNNICSAISIAASGENALMNQTIISVGPTPALLRHENIPIKVLQNISSVQGFMNPVSNELWDELKNYDLIHIHQSLTIFGAFCTAVAKSLRIPVVTTDLGGGNEETMLSGKGLELSDGVLSISEYAQSLINSNFTGPKSVVIGPIDCDFFKRNHSIKRDRDSVLCVSRILPHKGIDRIIEALPKGLKLTVVGRVYNEKYHDLLLRMSAGKDVTFVTDADDAKLIELYQSSGLFVQASTHVDCYGNKILKPELMGLTTLEAMACGIPVVVSDAGSLPELVTSGEIGRIFSNKQELEEIFQDYLSGQWPGEYQEELSRKTAEENYSYVRVGQKIISFYRKILGETTENP